MKVNGVGIAGLFPADLADGMHADRRRRALISDQRFLFLDQGDLREPAWNPLFLTPLAILP